MPSSHPHFVILFMVGAIIFFVGVALRLFLYWRGQWNVHALVKGVFSTLFSRRILKFLEILLLDGVFQRKLFGQDKLRWLMKVLIMVGYPGILIAGHLKVDVMAQFRNVPFLIRFFYAPFCDYYTLRDFAGDPLGVSGALFAISFDLFGAMILAGEFIALYRRFVAKVSPFKSSVGDIVAVNLLGGWFILRFFCEAVSILTYSIPNGVAKYWFVSFLLSKAMAPLGLPWSSLNDPLWYLSGGFLAALVASIPFNKKLWHIVTIPVVMFTRVMPRESFRPGPRKAVLTLSPRDLLGLDSCVKCGSCVEACPVYARTQQLETTMGGFFSNLKSFVRKTYGLPAVLFGTPKAHPDVLKAYSEHSFLCTLCGRCEAVCPAFIGTKDVRIAARGFMAGDGGYPESMNRLRESLDQFHNILGEPNEERSMWLQALGEIPGPMIQKENARVVYFVGCVASYFPRTKKIPQAFVQLLDRAGVDFTILGGDEWCCGFPLIGAGMRDKARALMEHNVEEVKKRGAEKVVFSCPSCYHTWMEEERADLEIFHSTQFIKKLMDEGKIRFKEQAAKVTYHDPCDLGRSSGVYEVPREILHAMPGVELVEMEKNRERCTCCGGGGNLEMVNPELSAAMARAKIDEIKATGADTVITACQQCVRTILSAARKNKISLGVMDLMEFVLNSAEGGIDR
jgi:heterodisulfide reductase subunit D